MKLVLSVIVVVAFFGFIAYEAKKSIEEKLGKF